MAEIPVLPWQGVKISKNPLENGVVFNSQTYDGYPLLIALTLPGPVIEHYPLMPKNKES